RALAIARSWIPAFPLRCFAASARQVAWMMVIFIIGIASPAAARTTATYGQNAVGTACNNVEKAGDFDAIAQCNSGTGAGTMQTAPIIVGTVTAPPYAATTCDASKAGMIQWTGTSFQGCDGSDWVDFGGGSSATPDPCDFTFPWVGAVCADGSVYAGISPDGYVKMYTTPCDQGQTWSGSACTGTRSTYKWGTYGVSTGYTSTTDGDGNTAGLVANYGTYTDLQSTYGVPAAQACADLTAYGHSDWHLPASEELNVLYAGKVAISGFDTSGTYYWSSREYNNFNAYYERFSDGLQHYNPKYNYYLVRCVRR
ncbi:MAG: DUF1566 domain-containing protein, partial [Bdellovibrionales bacterium]